MKRPHIVVIVVFTVIFFSWILFAAVRSLPCAAVLRIWEYRSFVWGRLRNGPPVKTFSGNPAYRLRKAFSSETICRILTASPVVG